MESVGPTPIVLESAAQTTSDPAFAALAYYIVPEAIAQAIYVPGFVAPPQGLL